MGDCREAIEMTEENDDMEVGVFDKVESTPVPDEYKDQYDAFTDKWISNSSLTKVMTCGIAFYKSDILRIPEPRGIRSTAGSGGHKGREVNLKQKIESGEDLGLDLIQDAARDYVHKTFDEHPIQPDKEFDGKGRSQLRDITTDFAVSIAMVDREAFQTTIQPKLVEHRMAFNFPGMSRTMVGMTDVVDILDNIRDLKSAKRSWGQSKADTNAGLTTYGVMRYAETGKLPENYYIDNVVCSGKSPAKPNALVTTRSKAQLSQHLQRFIAWNKVIDAGIFGCCDPNHFKCSESYCGYYKQCKYGKPRKG